MTKRRSTWLGRRGALFLVLSLSGVAAGACTPPDAVPDRRSSIRPRRSRTSTATASMTTARTTTRSPIADAAAARAATVDVDGDGVISTTEAAHSARIGGKNCNHGGYVSWIAHQEVTTAWPSRRKTGRGEPDRRTTASRADRRRGPGPGRRPDADVAEPEDDACADASDADAIDDREGSRGRVRAALKAERTLARETAKAERSRGARGRQGRAHAARDAKKAERGSGARRQRRPSERPPRPARASKGH